jgi:hypothetical protein
MATQMSSLRKQGPISKNSVDSHFRGNDKKKELVYGRLEKSTQVIYPRAGES